MPDNTSKHHITVFTAARVITMNESWPTGTAIAVAGDRIIEVGTLETMEPWLKQHPHTIDERFASRVITPGFIDPHLHPTMAAVLLPMHFITAMRWQLPWGTVEPTVTGEAFDQRLTAIHDALPAAEPLLSWGYHQLWHGDMSRARINAITGSRPAIVWHRSFHELYMNDAAMAWLEISESAVQKQHHINYATGHFFEVGLGYALNKLNPHILSPQAYAHGLDRLKKVVHAGGHTTIGDMATGLFDFDTEWQALNASIEQDSTPFRVRLVAHALRATNVLKDPGKAVAFANALPARNTHRLQFARHIKLFADGAFFSQLAQLQKPGYIDGHHGEWLMSPEQLEAAVRPFWRAGYRIHVHVTGDLGVELALDILEKMQTEHTRLRHGFTLEHFGISTPEQVQRIADLGASISANVYYLHELSDTYARNGIGVERAATMARLGSAMRAGINTAVHSDFTMAPAEPLTSAWVAVNRTNAAGKVMGEAEKLTPYQALQAITINAARILSMENDIGSLRAGKKADFTVLDQDPLESPAEGLHNIKVIATVFEGKVFPVEIRENS